MNISKYDIILQCYDESCLIIREALSVDPKTRLNSTDFCNHLLELLDKSSISQSKKPKIIAVQVPIIEDCNQEASKVTITTRQRISSGLHYFNIYDKNGYDFTSEYSRIYFGKLDQENIYQDTLIICQRAIYVAFPNMNQELLKQSAEKIINVFSKDLIKLETRLKSSLSEIFIDFKSKTILDSESIQLGDIYISKQHDRSNLSCWLKVQSSLKVFDTSDRRSSQRQIDDKESFKIEFFHYFEMSSDCEDDNTSTGDDSPIFNDCEVILLYWKDLLVKSNKFESTIENTKVNHSIKMDIRNRHSLSNPMSDISTHQKQSEIFGWGTNCCDSLGFPSTGDIFSPLNIYLPLPITLDPIKMIACGPRHTLILTTNGFIFSVGDNSEGALGVGDIYSRSNFCPVLMNSHHQLAKNDSKDNSSFVFTKISAGGGELGSHSMAIDSVGQLYGWGSQFAAGVGLSSASKLNVYPAKVLIPLTRTKGDENNEVSVSDFYK